MLSASTLVTVDSNISQKKDQDHRNENDNDRRFSIGYETYAVGNEKKEKKEVEEISVRELDQDDPWAIQDLAPSGTPWSQLTEKEKLIRVGIGIGKFIGLTFLLYFFVCSLDSLSLGFRLVGGKTTGDIFRQSDIIKNPIVGVMIGILTTVLVQSSSTSTSIIVSMVSAKFLDVREAIPIIMGANIGTSITNTIVSLTQSGDRNQFRRAFAGATVHDMFNWLTVIVLLIVELTTGLLYHLTSAILVRIDESTGGSEIELLGKITKPFVNLIVQLDKKVLECWSSLNCTDVYNSTIKDGDFLFADTGMSDGAVGAIVLISSLLVLCLCLIMIVKILNSVLQGQIASVIKKTLNANIPYIPWITGYIAIGVGAVMTFLVQSSSVFTSALTPLVGLGVITVERVYPLTLGSNIGTTTTALLASMAVQGDRFKPSIQIALCHLFFNIFGILLFYPIPFMRFPIPMAKKLGETTAKYRWFAIAYMILMFVALPVISMGLSFAGLPYLITFVAIAGLIVFFVTCVNFLRSRKPSLLPPILRSWEFLPLALRSLQPYDDIFSKFAFCQKLKSKGKPEVELDNRNNANNARRLTVTSTTSVGNGQGNVNRGFEE